MRLTLCEAPTHETRPGHNIGNYVPYSFRQASGLFNVPCQQSNTEDAWDEADWRSTNCADQVLRPEGDNVSTCSKAGHFSLAASLHPNVSTNRVFCHLKNCREISSISVRQCALVLDASRIPFTCLNQAFLFASLPSFLFFFFSYSSFRFSSLPFSFSWFLSLASPSLA